VVRLNIFEEGANFSIYLAKTGNAKTKQFGGYGPFAPGNATMGVGSGGQGAVAPWIFIHSTNIVDSDVNLKS